MRLPFPLVLLRLWGLRVPLELEVVPLEREAVPRERDAVPRDRVDADDFERDEPPEARDEPLRDPPLAEREDPLAFGFEREPLDELPLLCPLRGADLLAAIRDTPLIRRLVSCSGRTHLCPR